MVATLWKILTIYEANCECVWLRYVIKNIWESCELSFIKDTSIILHEDNIVRIEPLKV